MRGNNQPIKPNRKRKKKKKPTKNKKWVCLKLFMNYKLRAEPEVKEIA